MLSYFGFSPAEGIDRFVHGLQSTEARHVHCLSVSLVTELRERSRSIRCAIIVMKTDEEGPLCARGLVTYSLEVRACSQ